MAVVQKHSSYDIKVNCLTKMESLKSSQMCSQTSAKFIIKEIKNRIRKILNMKHILNTNKK